MSKLTIFKCTLLLSILSLGTLFGCKKGILPPQPIGLQQEGVGAVQHTAEVPDCTIDVIASAIMGADKEQRKYFKRHRAQFEMAVNFVKANECMPRVQSFVVDAMKMMQQYRLTFLIADDLRMLYQYPEIYLAYKQFLAQHPDATEEQKAFPIRFVFEGPGQKQ